MKNITGYDSSGKPSPITAEKKSLLFEGLNGGMLSQDAVSLKPNNAGMITVLMDSGYWTETPDDWANLSKKYFRTYDDSNQEWNYNKTIFKWAPAYSKPVGLDLEIVPLANPWDKTLNGLPVQLLYKGKPLAATEIELDGNSDVFTTDKDGRTTIPMHESGVFYIGTKHKEKINNDPDRDGFVITTNLIFTR
jgi:nickel transport protein